MRTITIYALMKNNFDFQLDEYPIFNEDYRPVLNYLILEHYKWHEIAYENPAKWRDRLKYRMYNIMTSYYNELFEKRMLEFNPFDNVNMTEEFTREVKSSSDMSSSDSSNSSSNSNNSSRNESEGSNTVNNKGYNYNFPDTILTNSDLDSNGFATNGNKLTSLNNTSGLDVNNSSSSSASEDTRTSSGNTTSNDIETYTRRTYGSSAGLAFSKAMLDLKEFYDNYNLNNEIIECLSDLFLGVWDI